MNAVIQSQLDRVESALTTLIDSIASYNPSIPAANNLLAADDELQKGLKQVAAHQANHARILALHERIAQQNAQITSTLTTLADTRTDLLSTPTSLPRKGARNVPYTELLDYAKRISRYTVPPTVRPLLPPSQPQKAATPAVNGETETGKEAGQGVGTDALEDEEKRWLEPLMQIPFVPWVSDDVMRRGALAQIQAMVERGEDPAAVADKVEESKEDEPIEAGEGMEDVIGGDVVGHVDVGAKEVEIRPERREEKPRVFGGLDLYDPTSLDEDE